MYAAALHLAAIWNVKAKSWVEGRKNWQNKIELWKSADKKKYNPPAALPEAAAAKTIWMHCASLGEFEQGRPLLEALKTQWPGCKIVLTFFSPSGYEIRKHYEGADLVMYLPMDGAANAAAFVETINPSLVLWVKYEYWHYYLSALKKRKIPVLLISGIFRETQPFFAWYGSFWKNMLTCFHHLFVQTKASQELLRQIDFSANSTVAGDTRFDRVIAIAGSHEAIASQVKQFCANRPVIVAGSSWEEDEEELMHYTRTHPNVKFIIAPHETGKERIVDLQKEFPGSLLYSSFISKPFEESPVSNVLIVDNVGTLARLYKYATIAYVGGGFNQSGIHNILEAAVYGKPVIFGPVYEKFAEARDLVEAGGAFSIENALELEALLSKLLENEEELSEAGRISEAYVRSHQGATASIMNYIQINRLLIS
ncbi:MAG: 3-deoxy-D-manno-octulosonic acid transferase [Gloeobacteraceae cyanobacterium ES-bin-316]|nr:3-deoxy-D-manno-octulosonic acid transferase [Ferruginibacter sp.]